MRILLVEDDEQLNSSLKYQLEKAKFTVDDCFDGEEALYYMEQNIYDAVLLDRMLPHLDGIGVLKRIRTNGNSTPVIMLTAMGTLDDRISGLDTGADDYLVKPFAFEELLARIRSVTRRSPSFIGTGSLVMGDLTLFPSENRLSGPTGSCGLSKKECELLEAFLRNPEQTLTRAMLLARVWGMESEVEDGNLDNYIYFLRRRLRAVDSGVKIRTIRGVGYGISER